MAVEAPKRGWLSQGQIAKKFGVSHTTVKRWAMLGELGEPHHANGVNKYDPQKVREAQMLHGDETVPLLQEALSSALKELGVMAKVLTAPQQDFIRLQQEEIQNLRAYSRELQQGWEELNKKLAEWHVMVAQAQIDAKREEASERRKEEAWTLLQEQLPRIVDGVGAGRLVKELSLEHLTVLEQEFLPDNLKPLAKRAIERKKKSIEREAAGWSDERLAKELEAATELQREVLEAVTRERAQRATEEAAKKAAEGQANGASA